ncbi:unnamed protein product [Bemisia tabaci]|uniref:Heparan-alpha-glucosaminide N-acetyltransferase catalytic domain-containing protein n=1 Tax=Bemisia tabaci TaxID=7038 RepID=A0A9P0A7W1_BEMTA|nr:unnamed protein product [Bemisia tabaci]
MWFEDPGTEEFRGLNLKTLDVDEAYLNITLTPDAPQSLHLYSLTSNCHQCPYSLVTSIAFSTILTVSAAWHTKWRLYADKSATLHKPVSDSRLLHCEFSSPDLGEFGVYDVLVTEDRCHVHTAKTPVNIYAPLILAVLAILALLTGYIILENFLESRKKVIDEDDPDYEKSPKRRVNCVDTFRGFAIILMIFINDGGASYVFLEHATWDGIHLADFIFPWFLWIMGVCIPLSVRSSMKTGAPRYQVLGRILRRTFLLFLIGVALGTVVDKPFLESIRIMGVLQRIAICYFVVAFFATILYFNVNFKNKFLVALKDLIIPLPQWVFHGAIVAFHTWVVFTIAAPGCPKGYMGPGGIQNNGIYKNCTGGISGHIDRTILGVEHTRIFPWSGVVNVYKGLPLESEGVFSSLLAIFQTFLGAQAGYILLHQKSVASQVKRWFLWGFTCGLVGIGLNYPWSNPLIPIVKDLWTMSFVLITSSLAFFFLGILAIICDHSRIWSGAPFSFTGKNSTFLYIGHFLCYQMFPWHWIWGKMNTHTIQLAENLWGLSLWILFAYYLHRKKFYLTL